MSTECTNIQLLQPESDVLVGLASGSFDQSLEENGFVPLAIGQQEVVVNFATAKLSNDFEFTALYIENLVDRPPMSVEAVPVVRTVGGFTAELSGAPDTVNYTLFWRVRVRTAASTAPSPTPPPSTDPAESARTPILLAATQLTVTFAVARSTINYGFSELRIENLIDGSGQQVEWLQVIAKTLTSFTVAISPPPDTANYILVSRTP